MSLFKLGMLGKRDVIIGWSECEFCETWGENKSYTARRCLYFFSIPIWPLSGRVRAIMHCSVCSGAQHMPIAIVKEQVVKARQTVEEIVAAIEVGQDVFDCDGKDQPCLITLTELVQLIISFDDIEYLEDVCDRLYSANYMCAHHCVRGKVLEFLGQGPAAAEAYLQAIEAEPKETHALFLLGEILMHTGNFKEAEQYYVKAHRLAPDDIFLVQPLLEVYENTEEHEKNADIYETCFCLVPRLVHEEWMVENYHGVCEHVGRTPVVG